MRKVLLLLFLAATLAMADESAEKLVRLAIDHAGGWDKWAATRTVRFRRTTVRYAPDGAATATRVQLHQYVLHPSPRMRIEWEENGSKIVMINDGHQAWKLVDGKRASSEEDIKTARNTTFGANYVFTMPFKLREPGTQLADAGTQTLADGTTVQKLRVTYPAGVGDAGGMHDWYFLLDKNGRLTGTHLLYEPGKWDWTEYLDEKTVDGFTLPTRRVGYDGDEKGKVGTKHSQATYENIEFNVDLSDDLFAPPR
ncbi:MAG: hypothetical protein H0T95_09995 [Chthoniobacterales bacterium]|nr:hypothetical protein [Chthoniobacterales bacterium]MBA3762070.1 hypothetical protein [Chthoniobacterales bacterium]